MTLDDGCNVDQNFLVVKRHFFRLFHIKLSWNQHNNYHNNNYPYLTSSSNLGASHHHQHRSHGNSVSVAEAAGGATLGKPHEDEKQRQRQSFSFGESLRYWVDKNGEPIRFVKIAGMHSELIGVSAEGKLHQWKWGSESPFHLVINLAGSEQQQQQLPGMNQAGQITVNHPKTLFLQLFNERICGLSASTVRASCWTESGKVCWSL